MDLHTIKQKLQEHFTDGLVTIIGCGLSMAEGLPGMWDMAQYLKDEMPKILTGEDITLWLRISTLLDKGRTIEEAMIESPHSPNIEAHLIGLVVELVLKFEIKIIEDVFANKKELRFTKLLRHMVKSNFGIPIITTNYDRLLEFASEMAGFGVDTLFVGHLFGRMNEKESKMSFCRDVFFKGKGRYGLRYTPKVLVFKPHGSLDWFLLNDEPIRCPLRLLQNRLIITPGQNKFRTGYDRPFDKHREKANEWIDRASRYLIIGYGFNDDHLETHLSKNLREGRPALILTHTLSANAVNLINECPGIIAITADEKVGGAHMVCKGNDSFIPGPDIWDLDIFIQEVLEP